MKSRTEKAPFYPWYPRDFMADEPVIAMTLEAEGCYRRLLDHQWLHGSVPGDMPSLARICKNIPLAKIRRLWGQVEPCFPAVEGDPGRRQNRRLERIRTEHMGLQGKLSEGGRKGAKRRWEGHNRANGQANSPAIGGPSDGQWQPEADTDTEPEAEKKPADMVLAYHVRCIVALNRALRDRFGNAVREISASQQQGVVDWEADGIPIELVESVIASKVAVYRATDASPQPQGLRYFDRPVRAAWDRQRAGPPATAARQQSEFPAFPKATA